MPPKLLKKQKQQKQINIERILLYTLAQAQKPQAFFTIKAPDNFPFPLQSTLLEGIQLLQQYNPKQINKKITQQHPLQRISKHLGKLCLQFKNKGFIYGSSELNLQSISAYAYGPNYFIVAFQNKSLTIYSIQMKIIKQFRNFSEKKITTIRIVSCPNTFEGIVIITSSGFNLSVHRFQKSFFSTLTCKLSYQIIEKSKTPIVQIAQMPRNFKTYLTKDTSYADATLLAVISVDQIWVLRINYSKLLLDKIADVVFMRNHQNSINPSIYASAYVSWNQAQINSLQYDISGVNLILNYCFGSNYYMAIMRCVNQYLDNDSKMKFQWVQSNPFIFQQRQIIFCQHIKKKQVLLILKPNQVVIFHTQGIDLFDNPHKSTDKQLITYSYENKIQSHKLTLDSPIQTYSDSFLFDYATNQINCIHKYLDQGIQKIGVGLYVYCNWKQICDMLKLNQNYISAMNFIIALFKKANRFQLGMKHSQKDNTSLSEYIHDISIEYVKQKFLKIEQSTEQEIIIQLQKKYSQYNQLLLTPFQLLINTFQFRFLFQKFKPILCSQYITDRIFYKILQPFIQHGKIKYIPNQELITTLQYYINIDRLDIIQRMAISFDLDLIQRGIVIQCCLNNNLTVSLAYICTQGTQSQFITPFIKFLGMGLNYKSKGQIQYAQLFAVRALWYVKLCLQRNMALKDYSYDKYGRLMKILTQKIFTKAMIKSLLEIRVQSCLDTLSFYFSKQNVILVNEYCDIKYSSEIKMLEYIKPTQENLNLQMMFSGIVYYLEQMSKNRQLQQEKIEDQQYLFLFISKIIIFKTVKFQKNKYLQILKYLIKNYKIIKRINYGLEKYPDQGLDQQQTDQIYASEYINKLLILIKFEVNMQPNQLNQIYNFSRLVPLTQLQAQISFLQSNYKNCLELYLRGRESSKIRIFRFLQNNFKNLILQKKDKQRKKFEKVLKNKIEELIALDPAKCQKIIQNYLPQSQQQLINALQHDQILQLQYLENVINTNFQLSDNSLLKYIQLMCKNKPNNLLQIFKIKNIFPVQESLKLCQTYKVYDCMQYLYERLGCIQQSVKIASLRIQQIFLLKYNGQIQENDLDPYIKIANILSNAIQVCIKYRSQLVWESLFDSSVKLFKRFKQDENFAEEINVFYEINAKILYNLMSYCSLEHIIWLIQTKYYDLDMGGSMKKAFIQILSNYSYKVNIFYTAQDLDKTNLCDYNQIYDKKVRRAYSIFGYCCSCYQILKKKEKSISFFCGHAYHKDCVLQFTQQNKIFCVQCLKLQQNQFKLYLNMSKQLSNNIKIDKIIDQSQRLKEMMIQNIHNEQKQYIEKVIQQKNLSKINNRLDKIRNYDKLRQDLIDRNYKLQKQMQQKKKRKDQINLKQVIDIKKAKIIYGPNKKF